LFGLSLVFAIGPGGTDATQHIGKSCGLKARSTEQCGQDADIVARKKSPGFWPGLFFV
jgi:hypothetical protein